MYLWNCRSEFSFTAAMRRDAAHGNRVLVLLSASYLCEQLTTQEWIKAASENLHDGNISLFAARFGLCDTEKFLSGIPYLDLVGRSNKETRDLLIARLQKDAPQSIIPFDPIFETGNVNPPKSDSKPIVYPFSTITLTQLKAADGVKNVVLMQVAIRNCLKRLVMKFFLSSRSF